MSGTSGSSGFGSVSIEQIERSTVHIDVSPGASHDKAVLRTFRDGQCWTPLIPQNVQANRAVGVDVGVVDLRRERDLRGLEGVVGGESDGEEEDAASVR